MPRARFFGVSLALLVGSLGTWVSAGAAAPIVERIPLAKGLVLVSTLQSPGGDRENVVTVQDLSPEGVRYGWALVDRSRSGVVTRTEFSRFVRSADLESAKRLHTVYATRDRANYPGYTAYSVSTAIYDAIAGNGESPFGIAELDPDAAAGLGADLFRTQITFKGTLKRRGSAPAPFPLLVNGKRVDLPALHLAGVFSFQDRNIRHELWVLADRSHPLLLKAVTDDDVWQLVRVDTPIKDTPKTLERSLQELCRTELPGVYFAFGTAELDDASNRTLAEVAAVLRRHPDWSLSIEGHTDNVGTAAANRSLSGARAAAVVAYLVNTQQLGAARLQAQGFGDERPREPNTTAEGRARNRRVELARPCGTPNEEKRNPR